MTKIKITKKIVKYQLKEKTLFPKKKKRLKKPLLIALAIEEKIPSKNPALTYPLFKVGEIILGSNMMVLASPIRLPLYKIADPK
jgi:hypothetical protein